MHCPALWLLPSLSLGVGWAHAATLDECVSVRVSNANAYWYVSSPVASPGPVSLQNAAVTVEDAVYVGEAVTPRVTVTLGGAALVEGEDYTVSCVGNDAVGSALAIAAGTGEYSGTASAPFEVLGLAG